MQSGDTNFAQTLKIRKWVALRDEVLLTETYAQDAAAPLLKVLLGAVVRNPFAGQFGEDLSPLIDASECLASAFVARFDALLAGAVVESHGKASIVGSAGSVEHGKALLTTRFANVLRQHFHATEWVPSTVKLGAPGTAIDVPLACCTQLTRRSHYDTISGCFADAPLADEILVLFAVASRGRLCARLG